MQSCVVLALAALAVLSCASGARQIIVTQTAQYTGDRLTPKGSVPFVPSTRPPVSNVTLVVNSTQQYQSMLGFGGAFTDSACHVLSLLNETNYNRVMDAYFGPDGLQYTFGRIPMGACDFSLNPQWSYANVSGDFNLTHFTIEKDLRDRIPYIKDALQRRAETNQTLKLFGSPWSAPGWMKANGHMICGASALIEGCALINKPEYYTAFANYFVKFVQEYAKIGLNIWGVTITNEPQENLFTYEGMVFTPETERDFVKNYMGPIMRREVPNVNIMYLDHNKNMLVDWASTILGDPEAAQYLWGAAVHWYTGDHFDALAQTHNLFPDKSILATEATVALDEAAAVHGGTWSNGEHYAHDMIGDFNNWVRGFVDWNIILDRNGGPLHVGPEVSDLFGSDSMMIADTKNQVVYFQTFYYYMGHFSKFVPENSVRIGWQMLPGNTTNLETVSFVTPSDNVVVIVMNANNATATYTLVDQGESAQLTIPAHGIQTLLYPRQKQD